MAELWKGAPAAAALTEQLTLRCQKLKERNMVPTLAILRVGERPDDIAYETGAVKRCEKIGVAVRRFLLPSDCGREALLAAVRQINEDPDIHGCLMFRPLAVKADEDAACSLLSPEKDVDGMTAASLGSVFTGNGVGFPPCTAQACLEILDHYQVPLSGKRVAVIGRSLVIGKPVSMMLQARNATVTMCHSRTVDTADICRDAEILISAAGKAGMVTAEFVRPGQIILDVGINVNDEGTLCGDVDLEGVSPIAGALTPVPGGVGSVTTTILASHVVEAAERTLR